MTSRATRIGRIAASAAVMTALSLGAGAALADETKACLAASDQAQSLRDEGKLKDARAQMLICARDACPAAVRKDCSAWLAAIETSLPSVVISAQDDKHNDLIRVQVSVDGKPVLTALDGRAMPIDPGPHKIKFEAEGLQTVEQTVLIREGEQRRVISIQIPSKGAAAAATTGASGDKASPGGSSDASGGTTPPDTTPAGPTVVPIPAIVVAGLGVVGIGVFAGLGASGKSDLSKLRSTCGVTHTCAQSDVDRTHNKLLGADISLATGVLALGVATGLFFALRHPKAPAKAATTSFDVGAFPLGKGGAAVVRGSF